MTPPRKKENSRIGSQQTNKYFHILDTPLRLVDHTNPAIQEKRFSNNSLTGRRSTDNDYADLYDRWYSLSPREQDVAYYVSQAYLDKQIAFLMGVSVRTVKSYLKNVFFKMNVPNRVELRLKLKGFDFKRNSP